MSTFISYAQNFEDVLLWRALKHVEAGFYIDVGANSPMIDSVSLAFYEKGWRGVNVEPSLTYINELRVQRPNDVNLHAALSAERGLLKFYDIPETGLSTLVQEVARQHSASGFEVKEDWVSVVTLDDVLDDLPHTEVHWMKIDVEGAETQVLEGWKSSSIRPWIVVVEGVEPNSHIDSHDGWEPALLAKGYRFVHFDGLNRYYVSDQQPQLTEAFKVGPNVFDRFCLSGTATSTFTSLLTFRLGEAAQQLEAAHERARALLGEQDAARMGWEVERAGMADEMHAARKAWEARWAELAEEGRTARMASEAREADLSASIAALESQRLALQDTLQRVQILHEQERNTLQARVIETLSEFRNLVQERDAARESFRQQSCQLAQAVAESDTLKSSKTGLLEELRVMSAQIDERNDALCQVKAYEQELLSSTSWRITAPLRLLTAAMRGSRKGVSLYLSETLRTVAQVPGMRGMARRLIPENSRLRRSLTARTLPIANMTAPSLQLPALPGVSGLRGSDSAKLLARMTERMRQDNPRTESQA